MRNFLWQGSDTHNIGDDVQFEEHGGPHGDSNGGQDSEHADQISVGCEDVVSLGGGEEVAVGIVVGALLSGAALPLHGKNDCFVGF
jgi:hypothetical protein